MGKRLFFRVFWEKPKLGTLGRVLKLAENEAKNKIKRPQGKERGEATPRCDSSPQQAAGYSRWIFIKDKALQEIGQEYEFILPPADFC